MSEQFIETVPVGGVNFNALLVRLLTTCLILISSPNNISAASPILSSSKVDRVRFLESAVSWRGRKMDFMTSPKLKGRETVENPPRSIRVKSSTSSNTCDIIWKEDFNVEYSNSQSSNRFPPFASKFCTASRAELAGPRNSCRIYEVNLRFESFALRSSI